MNTVFNFLLLIIKVALAMYIAIFIFVLAFDFCKAMYAKRHSQKQFIDIFIFELKNDLHTTFVKVLNPLKFISWIISII